MRKRSDLGLEILPVLWSDRGLPKARVHGGSRGKGVKAPTHRYLWILLDSRMLWEILEHSNKCYVEAASGAGNVKLLEDINKFTSPSTRPSLKVESGLLELGDLKKAR